MGLMFRPLPFWPTATGGLLLLATMLAPVTVTRQLIGLVTQRKAHLAT